MILKTVIPVRPVSRYGQAPDKSDRIEKRYRDVSFTARDLV